jgi:DNA-directed RNA polymerase I subunit RPA12
MSKDIEFCPVCGTILPLPGDLEYVVCYNEDCKLRVSITDFDGAEVVSQIVFNKIQMRANADAPTGAESGAMADRTCGKCGNEKMSYMTRQTRSADEGQTVFYLCPACNNQEIEYS